MQIHDFQPMFEVKGRSFLTNSVEKGFSQPWKPLLETSGRILRKTNFFFLFVAEFTAGRSSKKEFPILCFENAKEPI